MNCGLPISGINLAYTDTGTVGTQDCDIAITLAIRPLPSHAIARYCASG